MNLKSLLISVALIFIGIGCDKENDVTNPDPKQYNFEFSSGLEGWIGGFADYPVTTEADFELETIHSVLPLPLDQKKGAIKQSGNNHSDDLFMFVKKKINNLAPNQNYKITYNVEIATNAPDSSVGVGGSPGSSVFVKVGATQIEPNVQIDNSNYYRMNIDKANQSASGTDMIVIGDLSNGLAEYIYNLKTLTNTTPFEVKSNSAGELWLIIGTDSGYESTTTVYYSKIAVQFK
jgi:hypothetical protein